MRAVFLRRPWAISLDSIVAVDNKEFFVASKCDRALRTFLGIDGETKTWGVLDAIASCRTEAIEAWCKKRLLEDDPMASVAELPSPSKKEMKMLKCTMPASLLVHVPASGECAAHNMRVLTGTTASTKVAFEISDGNFRWLFEAVQVGDYTAVTLPRSQSRAKLGESLLKTCKDVRWREQRKTLWTTYRQKGKMRTLSKRVSSCSDESRAERKITQEAARLQSLRDSMHEQSTKKRKSHADAHSTPSNAASSGHATSDF